MRLKGINPIEAHVEKIVLGLFAAVFLGVVAMQFLHQPNLVQLPQEREKFPPKDAFRPAERLADQLESRMTRLDPELPEGREFNMLPRFIAALERPVTPSQRLAGTWPAVTIGLGAEIVGAEGLKIALPPIPAPATPIADVYLGTIDPYEALASPELAAILPPKQPYDVRAVTIEATYNGRALLAALERDPDGAGELMPLNPGWWRGLVEILAVKVEREELLPSGDWSNLQEIPAPPGRQNGLALIGESVTRTRDMEVVVAEASKQASEIRRPTFYGRVAGAEWVPPSEAAAARARGMARSEAEELLAKRRDVEREIARLEGLLGRRSTTTQPDRDPGRGGGGGSARGGGGQQQQQEQRSGTSATERIMLAKLNDLDREIEQIDARLRAMGRDPSGETQTGGMMTGEQDLVKPLLEDDAVRLWTFDMTAQPGKTYRYRTRIVVNNPAFGRGAALHETSKRLAEAKTLVGEASPWSEPITVDPQTHYFFTSATDGSGLGLMSGPRATAEIFTFYYGYWRKGTVGLEPGDPIRAMARLPDNLFVVDLQEPGATPTPPPPSVPGGPELPPGARLLPKEVEVSTPVILLDVAPVPASNVRRGIGTTRPTFQVVVRDVNGNLEVRQPDTDRSSEQYTRLAASAKQGESQGQPTIAEAPPDTPDPRGPRGPLREPQPETPRPGRGGGGGGGGG